MSDTHLSFNLGKASFSYPYPIHNFTYITLMTPTYLLITKSLSSLAGFWQIIGNQVAQGKSFSKPCSISRACRTATYKDLPLAKALRKFFKNYCATKSGTCSRITMIWRICKEAKCLANPKPSPELKIASCKPRSIAFLTTLPIACFCNESVGAIGSFTIYCESISPKCHWIRCGEEQS